MSDQKNNELLNLKRGRDTKKFLEKVIESEEKKAKKVDSKPIEIRSNKQPEEQPIETIPQIKKSEPKLILQQQGRIIDEEGNIVPLQPQMKYSLKININKEKEQKVKELIRTHKIDFNQSRFKEGKYYDPSIESSGNKRLKMKMRSFNFVEKGSFQKNLEEAKKRESAKKLGIDLTKTTLTEEEEKDLLNMDILHFRPTFSRQPLKLKALDLIPDVEPWDAILLPPNKKSFSPYWKKDSEGNWIHSVPDEIKFSDFTITENDFAGDKITSYVQHPVPIKNETLERINKISLPVFLAKKEKNKLRRIRRLDKIKEKQEQMKLGLIKPPPPKLKYGNFMRILGDEAIQDPSQVEKKVKKAYEERFKKMMAENEARKLTREQKAEKIKRKYERDSKKECKACIFKIQELAENKKRFKIDRNCQQLYLTGICIMKKRKHGDAFPNFLYVEGGPLAIKKMKNLLLRRIKWGEEETTNEVSKKCPSLIWEGNLKKRNFEKWKMIEVKTENDAIKILSEKGIDHFWNLFITHKAE